MGPVRYAWLMAGKKFENKAVDGFYMAKNTCFYPLLPALLSIPYHFKGVKNVVNTNF